MYKWEKRRAAGRVGSDFLSANAGRVESGRVNVSPGRVVSGPRKVTRGQLCDRQLNSIIILSSYRAVVGWACSTETRFISGTTGSRMVGPV